MKNPNVTEQLKTPATSARRSGSARRRTIKHVLKILLIFLLPICIAIAPGPASKVCMTIATMLFMSQLYIETLTAPNKPEHHEH